MARATMGRWTCGRSCSRRAGRAVRRRKTVGGTRQSKAHRPCDPTASAACDAVVLVVPPGTAWDGEPVAEVVEGGETRADSVRAGIACDPAPRRASSSCTTPRTRSRPRRCSGGDRSGPQRGADAAVPVLPATETIVDVDGASSHRSKRCGRSSSRKCRTRSGRGVARCAPRRTRCPRRCEPAALDRCAASSRSPGETTNVHITTRDELALAERMLVAARRDRASRQRITGSGTGTMNWPPARAVLGLLGHHLVREVPREQQHVVGHASVNNRRDRRSGGARPACTSPACARCGRRRSRSSPRRSRWG